MQNSIKVENAVLGETTFSGGVSTTLDKRLGAETGIEPEGNQDIETLEEYNVTDKATARISETERSKIIPENIKDGVTILGVAGSYSGGSKPTLFAPVATGGINQISWSNNPANGDFEVTLSADVDGTPVASPLTITQEMDGSTLTITASATGFESNSTVIEIAYISDTQSVVAIGNSTYKPFYVWVSQADIYFKNLNTNVTSTYVLAWNGVAGTEVYSDVVEISSLDPNPDKYTNLILSKGTNESETRQLIPNGSTVSPGSNLYATGTIKIKNLTKNIEHTFVYNSSYTGASSIQLNKFSVGDKIVFIVNFS